MLLFILIGGTAFNPSHAQEMGSKANFNSSFYYIATTLSAKNIDSAIAAAKSLQQASQNDLQQVRSLMLLATLSERTGDHSNALAFAVRGEQLAEKINNKEWMIRISGFLSSTFRELGLITEGRKYLEVAEAAANGHINPLIKVFISQEKAYYKIAQEHYREALSDVYSAMYLAEKTPSQKGSNIILATCHQMAGECYIELDSLQQAGIYLEKSLKALAGEESELKGYIYQNLGELSIKQHNWADAKKYLETALSYTASSGNFNLKLNTYKKLHEYYAAIGDAENALKFQVNYTKLVEEQSALSTKVFNELLLKLDNELDKKNVKNYFLYFVCIFLLTIIAFSVTLLIRVRKKERKKYLAYIATLEKQQLIEPETENTGNTFPADGTLSGLATGIILPTNPSANGEENEINDGNTPPLETGKREKMIIPKETEKRILRDLAEQEGSGFYLKNDISLSYLSVTLKTNSKYLSAIINKHKGKDFNNYINELRINYIIKKLRFNRSYWSYKIAYLSEESGFSSHSKFTAAFKNVTGISPSTFIAKLKKDAPQ